MPRRGRAACLLLLHTVPLCACSRAERDTENEARAVASATSSAPSPPPPPSAESLALLHLPRTEDSLPPPIAEGLLPGAPPLPRSRCPAEMVDVRGEFCIDRYESSFVDADNGVALSPHYHPTRAQTIASYERYRRRGASRAPAVPEPPSFQLERDPRPEARSLVSVLPQGYLSRDLAERACRAVGKRLCSSSEWVRACRGEQNRKFPYGEQYQDGACNVFREAHPAAKIHGDASREHLDPRLGLVQSDRGPLLRRTGESAQCRSSWGSDGIFDMVGNLDEWVADGGFMGGFFSRGTRDGCDARITSHPPEYFDYSLGGRCCR
ncbi:MAG: SUMF1/EgtB/PvdO family nonheme iron enzyme [Myxococcota bacterium]